MIIIQDCEPFASMGQTRPLVVDLDGALVRTDTVVETALAAVGRHPRNILRLLLALRGGKAGLTRQAASLSELDAALLPYSEPVLTLIRDAKAGGRPVYLASASDAGVAGAVASHLGFDGLFCSDGAANLSGEAKAQRFVQAFGQGNFDYVGAAWMQGDGATVREWLRVLRLHQWTKNALIFAPLVAAHAFRPAAIGMAMLGFIAFSLCASGVYLLNDLTDLQADRAHHAKRRRAFAAGRIPLVHGLAAAPMLLVVGIGLATVVGPPFLGVLGAYLGITTLYSFWLKQKLLVDVVVLALLYVVRVLAGAAAIAAPISNWFLGFALFIFTCLALVKRYVECAAVEADAGGQVRKRAYVGGDASVLLLLAAAAGFNAVTVLALFVSSDDVRRLYVAPQWLWMLCPVTMYWIARLLVLAQRGQVHDDPIVFAIRDRASLLTLGVVAGLLALAT
jgi:4-hydroxybenzoate polyprenyltransferase